MQIFEIFKVCDRSAIRASVTRQESVAKTARLVENCLWSLSAVALDWLPRRRSNDQQPIEQHRIQNLRRSL